MEFLQQRVTKLEVEHIPNGTWKKKEAACLFIILSSSLKKKKSPEELTL